MGRNGPGDPRETSALNPLADRRSKISAGSCVEVGTTAGACV
jgi:hypothetical protein